MTLPIKKFQTLQNLEQSEQFIQRNVQNALDPVLNTALLDGTLVTGVVVPASGTLVLGHGLGRPAQGYIVVSSTAPVSTPDRVTSEQTSPNSQLVLHFPTGAGATISMWIF